MGQARLTVPAKRRSIVRGLVRLGTLALVSSADAAGPSRFASYDSELQCIAAGTIAPAICRSAFANARTEYEAKTPSFPNSAACTRRFAVCMAWPPDADPRRASFRPRWDGVDIVDTPTEHSVTPSPGSTGRTIRFAARPLTEESRDLVIRGAGVPVPPSRAAGAPVIAGHPGRPSSAEPFVQRAFGTSDSDKPQPPAPMPPPGSGFKLEDGVLTYPAPARFQPKNLPK